MAQTPIAKMCSSGSSDLFSLCLSVSYFSQTHLCTADPLRAFKNG